MKAPPMIGNDAFKNNLKRLHAGFGKFDEPDDLLLKQKHEEESRPQKRRRISSINEQAIQRDPIENLISRILYAEGDIDLQNQDQACLKLLKDKLPSIVHKLTKNNDQVA